MSCIGTAGHVDHGKSTLVQALTGIDPDRLAEEKERGMTIDLGFAWLQTPAGHEVSIVDVPGHESFIKNMLAGVGGIDAALLVIAADEGIMPQTEEHLAILDLLGVSRGVVALTKCDLVEADWLEMVREEVEQRLRPTTLAGAPIVPVSAYTGAGLPELLAEIDRALDRSAERTDIGRPRLPIDRVFTITGFGTVVTGTLLDGRLAVGQEVSILPQGLSARIRAVQTHKRSIEEARPGSRVAINLAGVARQDLARGDVVARPGALQPTMLIDARLRLLESAPRPLAHNTMVDVYTGSCEVSARVALLDRAELLPGETAWAQLRLAGPSIVARRDRFIVRIPSPSLTIGGGEVIDPHPRYHRRHQTWVLEKLTVLEHAAPDELVLAALQGDERQRSGAKTIGSLRTAGWELSDISRRSGLPQEDARMALAELIAEGRVVAHGPFFFAQPVWNRLAMQAVKVVQEYHQQYPLRSGISREEWRSRLGLAPRLAHEAQAALVAQGALAEAGGALLRLPDFTPAFTPAQQAAVDQLLAQFRAQPFTPPSRQEAEALVGPDVLAALLDQGTLVKLSESVLFLRETYEDALARILDYVRHHGKITVAEARDLLGTSRKYMLALLEHCDERRLTRRVGDDRLLGIAALAQSNTTSG
jgi:selenocysteine-specific elongation factor